MVEKVGNIPPEINKKTKADYLEKGIYNSIAEKEGNIPLP